MRGIIKEEVPYQLDYPTKALSTDGEHGGAEGQHVSGRERKKWGRTDTIYSASGLILMGPNGDYTNVWILSTTGGKEPKSTV